MSLDSLGKYRRIDMGETKLSPAVLERTGPLPRLDWQEGSL